MIPSEGPRETAMMSDILGGFKTKEEKVDGCSNPLIGPHAPPLFYEHPAPEV